MPALLRCPQGHTWERPDSAGALEGDSCPICATNTDLPALRLEPGNAVVAPAEETVAVAAATLAVAPFGDRRTVELPTLPLPDLEERHTLPLAEVPTPTPALDDRVTVPGYAIEGVLGRGSMGVVYLAVHEATGQRVALKMLRGGFAADSGDHLRFLSEARALTTVQHPNIVRIQEAGEVQGQPFFALEYVPGTTLAQHLRGIPQPADATVALIRTLALALQAAHDARIVHRDLKPSNILLASDGTPKVLDFGLAKHLDSDAAGTRSGWIVGTPCYMAPEQASGHVGAVGPAADIYALGAILYECLTGRPPFQGVTPLDTLQQVQSSPLVAPRKLNPSVPRALETICLHCLEKDPERRYPSMAALADDLHRYARGERIVARRPTAAEGCQRWILRNPTLFGLLLTLGVTLFALATLVLWHSLSLQRELNHTAEANERYRREYDQGLLRQQLVEEREADLRRYLYAADLRQAQHLWDQRDVRSMRRVLAPYLTSPTEPRDFALRYLDRLLSGAELTLSGARGEVYSVAWSPDGTRLAATGQDGELRCWDARTGDLVYAVAAHTDEVNALAWSPDGEVLATASDDRRVRLWDAGTGASVATLAHPEKVVALVFSGTGQRLYTGDDTGTLQEWTRGPDWTARRMAKLGGRIEQLARSPSGQWLAAALGAGGARLVPVEGKEPERPVPTRAKAQAVTFLAEKLLAVGLKNGTVDLVDLVTGKTTTGYADHTDSVSGVDFLAGDVLISGGQEGALGLWSLGKNQVLGTLRGHAGRVWCVAASPTGELIASASADGTVKVWRPRERVTPALCREATAAFNALAVVPGVPLALLGTDNGVELCGNVGRSRTLPATPITGKVQTLAVSPDRRHVLASRYPGEVVLTDLVTGTTRTLQSGGRSNQPVVFSSDGQYAATAHGTGKVAVWKLPEGDQVAVAISMDAVIHTLAFQPGTHRLALATTAGVVSVWELTGTKAEKTWRAHHGDVYRLAFNPDGTTLATAGRDQVARLWDTTTFQELHHGLMGHRRAVLDVAFSPDGRLVVTGDQSGSVRVWSCATGRELLAFEPGGTITGTAFVDDNRLLVTSVENGRGSLRLYSTLPE